MKYPIPPRRSGFLVFLLLASPFVSNAQRPMDATNVARTNIVGNGFMEEDLGDLLIKDEYVSVKNGIRHTFLRQRWQGIEVFNGDIAVHQASDGRLVALNNGAWPYCAKTASDPTPAITGAQAVATVLNKDLPNVALPSLTGSDDGGRMLTYDGSGFGDEQVSVQLMYLPFEGTLRLVWNVIHYSPDGSHWWNVRIDANSGAELDRNDWVSQCGFSDHDPCDLDAPPTAAPAPAIANDMHVFPMPIESPIHGSSAVVNAPWLAGVNGSPFGWYDTDGVAGAEYTYTRGNNVLAQEDANGNNGNGLRPDGTALLDFDFPFNLTQAPANYQNAALTNLFYWNNIMHDVWYEYGFDEPSGNFQQNNYGNGGAGADYVLADGQDGSGTNNANFGTPPDGNNPRMQMFLWNLTTPNRDGDLDNGIIAHEYGHGISTRLVGGPSNSNCLNNNEQMGEGWSDYFGLMLTMRASDTRLQERGIGTYVLGQPTTGPGIRPAPYTTNMGVNGYTYADISGLAVPHGVGFMWSTMLWEMTWDLIDQYGFDADLYNGTGGNNIAMQLVIDGLKLTACNPGFVDGRDAILQADAVNNGGANQNLIWAAFARRGLGYSADQGSSNNVNDQTEAFDMPLLNDVGFANVVSPPTGDIVLCGNIAIPVRATLRNYGTQAQSGFTVRYSLDGAPFVTETYTGTLSGGATELFTFAQPILISTTGPHTLTVSTLLIGDEYAGDDQATQAINGVAGTTVPAPLTEDVEGGLVTPAGWTLQNPDNGTTWTTAMITNGAGCASTTAWTINYYAYNAVGQEDRLLTPIIDLGSSTSNHLTFDHAYARYSATYSDGFRVDVSTDCGSSWAQLFAANGTALATAPDNTGANWQPANCSEWQGHDLDLSAYDGQAIVLRFVGVCGYGQRLYFDNVNVSGTISAGPYYSRGNGSMADPIWSTTRNGTPSSVIWDGTRNMVIQTGNAIDQAADNQVKDAIVEMGGSLQLAPFTTLTVLGDSLQVVGTLTAQDNSAIAMVGTEPTIIVSNATLDLWNLETNTPAGTTIETPLAIRGTLQLTDGAFDASVSTTTCVSNGSTTGRLGPVGATASFIGDISMQRYVPGGATNWRFLGSAVAGATVAGWNDDFITAGFPGSDYPNFDSPVGSNILWPSIRWYDETVAGSDQEVGLVGVPSISDDLDMGQGFAAWCGDALGGTTPFTIDVTGPPRIALAPLVLPMTWTDSGNPSADGWNLVSNPLPSAILFSDITLGSDVASYVTFYDPANGNTAVYDKISQVGTNNATDLIQSSQGFWLKATGPGTATTVTESNKVNDNSGGFFGGDQQSVAELIRLRLSSALNDYRDETVLYFGSGSPGIDASDVPKLVFAHPSAPQIGTEEDGTWLAINAHGAYDADLVVPIRVKVAVGGTYTITVDGMERIGLVCLSLEDLETGITTPMENGATYSFSISPTEDTTPRFLLHGTAPIPFLTTDATCSDSNDGQAVVDLGLTTADVIWTDASGNIISSSIGSSGATVLDGLSQGTYRAMISGSACGSLEQQFAIAAPQPIELEGYMSTSPTCVGGADGRIAIDILGGVAPYSITWSNGSTGAVLNNGAGTYAVSAIDANGCLWSGAQLDIPAAIGARADFYLAMENVMVNTMIQLFNTSQLADQWTWDFDDGSTSSEFQPIHAWVQPGTYAVVLTASRQGCSNSMTRNVIVETSTAVQGSSDPAALRVWSTTQYFVVESAPLGFDHIEVFDALGQVVITRSRVGDSSARIKIPNDDLGTGIWFVRITSGTDQLTFRVPLIR